MTEPAPTRRVQHGRSHRYFLDGDAVQGVTTIIDAGVPKPALVDWAARETAGYAIDHWDELAELKLSERLRRLERARWEGRDAAAVRGQDVHALAHRLAVGERLEVPDPLIPFVDNAYLPFVDEWVTRDLLVEVTILNRSRRYMGTLDLVAELADGRTWILDFKTGSGVYAEAALQLAAYRHAEAWVDQDGAEQPLPPIDAAGVVWLRADGYDLFEVDAGADTFRTFLYAQQVAAFAAAAKDRARYISEAKPPPREPEAP